MTEKAYLLIDYTEWVLLNYATVYIKEMIDDEDDNSDDETDVLSTITLEGGIICHICMNQVSGSPCPICGEPYDLGTHIADVSHMYMETTDDAVKTLRRLGLLNKNLKVDTWKVWSAEQVTEHLMGREYGISINGDVITFGDERIDQESMEVLCMLDLMDKPLGWWHDEQ